MFCAHACVCVCVWRTCTHPAEKQVTLLVAIFLLLLSSSSSSPLLSSLLPFSCRLLPLPAPLPPLPYFFFFSQVRLISLRVHWVILLPGCFVEVLFLFVCLSSYVWHEERPLFDSSKVFIKNISETSIDVSTAARRLKDASCSVCVRAGVSARARGISCVCLSRRAAVLSLSRLKWINRSVARHSAKSEEVEFFFFSPPPQRPSRKTRQEPS